MEYIYIYITISVYYNILKFHYMICDDIHQYLKVDTCTDGE